ncbi:ankyrin repeat domain-containing protein [Streptomyces sp. NPDC002187]|uniref:ankyrin repeat domain-containing protein n=1 Tax=Streptomyces sp. NPDC002187 TaxID=3364637 RepID=UPI00368B925D
MSRRAEPYCFPRDEASSWGRIRRYAVPRWMIERATERRLAGDWPGACAAAGVDIAFDPAEVAREYGEPVAAALEDDLRHLAPDLLRWHLPRWLGGRTTLATDRTVVLAGYGPPARDGGSPGAPYLHVTTPAMIDGPQRISLRFQAVECAQASGVFGRRTDDWTTARHLWDTRRAAELRQRYGGGDRAPFFRTDGGLLETHELPTAEPGAGDPAARAEWVALIQQNGTLAEAFAAAGIELDLTAPAASRWYRVDPEAVLRNLALDLTRLEPEVRRLADAGVGDRFQITDGWRSSALFELTDRGPLGRLKVRVVERNDAQDVAVLPEALWRRLPDLDLLRTGGIAPQGLHPLVAAALFPDLVPAGPAGPPGPGSPAAVPVRCRGEWHEVAFRGGRLDMPHSEEEQQRERALHAFGGTVAGCFAVQHAATSGTGRLPKALRAQRRELFLRAQHGDTPGVLELLDAGVDPRVRDGGGRTLLHVLHLLDHEPLLPRLLSAGLDLEAKDHRDRTPLFVAVNDAGSKALVEALIDAGARIDAVDQTELSLAQVVRKYRRADLRFLHDRVRAEHPGIGADWWNEWHEDEDEEQDR